MAFGRPPSRGCDPFPGQGKICDCLGCQLERIAAANQFIGKILDDRLNKVCDSIDDCTDKILDKIKERLEGPLYSKQECKRMLNQGLGGTLEYAIRCARDTEKECLDYCSLTDEGECCTSCGQEPCVCTDGECVPVEEEEEEKKKKWYGYCNRQTGVVLVTREGEPPPWPGYEPVAIAESEHVAFLEAQSYCEAATERPQVSEPFRLPNWGISQLPFCSLQSLVNGNTLNIASAAQATFQREGGSLQVWNALSNVGAFGIELGDITQTLHGLFRLALGQPAFYADVAATKFAPVVGCANPTFQAAMRLMVSADLFQKQSGANISDWLLPYKYAMHAACRQVHLSPQEAQAAYLADSFSREGLEALYAIHGYCPEDVQWSLNAARSKPVPLQLAVMRHREIISPSEYHVRMRQLGFLEQKTREDLFKITYQVPTLTDIIRLMVRDTDDPTIPDWPDSDRLFQQKYGKQLKEWSQAQGVPELFAKYAWRAHWTIPPPTALFTFYHRLRNKPELWTDKGALADIEQALVQQDILPRWHKHYLAVSFHPMRLRDIRRSFQVGTLTEKEAENAFMQLGYSDETVDLMTKFLVRLRDNSVRNHIAIKQWYRMQLSKAEATAELKSEGLPDAAIDRAFRLTEPEFSKTPFAKAYVRGELSRAQLADRLSQAGVSGQGIDRIILLLSTQKHDHPVLRDYAVGMVDKQQAIQEMSADGFDTSVADNLVQETSREIERVFVRNCQNGIKRRYLLGELDEQDAQNELVTNKTTAMHASNLVRWWGCEIKAGEKHVSAKTLCDWLARGAITAPEFRDRLIRLGYDEGDAVRMIEDCLISVNVKRTREAKREAKEQAAEQNRISRLLEKQARETDRYNTAIKRQQEKAAATRARRQKALMNAAEKVHISCGCDMNDAWNATKRLYADVQSDYALTADEALQVLLLASDEFSGPDLTAYNAVVSSYAQQLVDAAISGKTSKIVLSNGNGKST